MPQIIECPECGRKLRVQDNLLGRKVKCPGCETTFTATGPDEEDEAPVVRRRRPAEDDMDDLIQDEPRPRRRPVADDMDDLIEDEPRSRRRPRCR